MTLYPEAGRPFDAALFREPGAAYRGAPFWAWNNKLDPDRLCRQLDALAEMGMGGAHIHSRSGLRTAYLGEEFLDCVRRCVDHCRDKGLLAWLYDEDRWPSGAAGGLVTRDPALRRRRLCFHRADDAQEGVLLARYGLRFDGDGLLLDCCRLADEGCPSGYEEYLARVQVDAADTWFNDQAYLDTLNPVAVQAFIAATHEVYAAACGADFGSVIPAIFTDEPQMGPLVFGQAVFLPWTDDLPETYAGVWAEDLLDVLPRICVAGPEYSVHAWRFTDHVTERFASAFGDQLGAWCDEHGIALTGHYMAEPQLDGQTHMIGEAMRHYRSMQLPGIDMLCDSQEFSTAKQAVSVARQDGREGVMSELYGVTGWHFDFAGHKAQGDWQAALGVTVRVHHLTWYSMQGQAKLDYPASIGPQSSWYKEYALIEDHFARVHVAMTRGRAQVRVAVVHPVESFWLIQGSLRHRGDQMQRRDTDFTQRLIPWLLHAQIDFDFIAESLLPGQGARVEGAQLVVGAMRYDAVLVPDLITMRSQTVVLLDELHAGGGLVLNAGRRPGFRDGLPDEQFGRSWPSCAFTQEDIVDRLADYRDVLVEDADGLACESVLCQLRVDGDERYLFCCNTQKMTYRQCFWEERGFVYEQRAPHVLRICGHWAVEELDTANGGCTDVAVGHERGWTLVPWQMEPLAHRLLRLRPCAQVNEPLPTGGGAYVRPPCLARLSDPCPIRLDEPNVLLLDQAAWRLSEQEDWRPVCELLRLDTVLRQALGWPVITGKEAQPWTQTDDVRARTQLRFEIDCVVAVTAPQLACERSEDCRVFVDGALVPAPRTGYWVDEDIHCLALPDLGVGRHVLVLETCISRLDVLSWVYLLGDFGVELRGRHARVTAPVRELAWGDWCLQGLPFYAGNVTYEAQMPNCGAKRLALPSFGGPLLRLRAAGLDTAVAFPPYAIGAPAAGPLEITAYGNRHNAFGPLHNANPSWEWWGPQAWFTEGEEWTDAYRLRPMGVLDAPLLIR